MTSAFNLKSNTYLFLQPLVYVFLEHILVMERSLFSQLFMLSVTYLFILLKDSASNAG